ncbi:hypothetical protein BDW62DRAFT_171459 [Aspergillus aurantiobrunneus]
MLALATKSLNLMRQWEITWFAYCPPMSIWSACMVLSQVKILVLAQFIPSVGKRAVAGP